MKKPADSETRVILNLNDYSPLAFRLGQFAAVFAGLEVTLWKLYGKIIGNELGAISLLGSIQSFATKLDAVERFVLLNAPSEEKRTHLSILREAREINSFRNDIFHAVYAEHPQTKSVWILTNLTDPSRARGKRFQLTEELLTPKIKQTNELSMKIVRLFNDELDGPGLPLTLIDRSKRSTVPAAR